MFSVVRLAGHILASNFAELDTPYRITMALTYRCQLRCRMCGIWKRSPAAELSIEQLDEFFRKANGFSWINLSGGEIFLRQDLLDVISVIRYRCRHLYALNFPTNGFQPELIERSVREILKTHRIPKLLITVSLDGPPLLHDEIRNVPGSWGRAVETFRRLRTLRSGSFAVYFGMTLQQANESEFEETVRAADELLGGVTTRDFHVNLAHASSHYYGNVGHVALASRHAAEQLELIQRLQGPVFPDILSVLERRYQQQAAAYLSGQAVSYPCQALGASLFMDPEGTVYPCTIYDRPIGNVRDYGYDLRGLWLDGPRRAARDEILKKKCPGCWTPCEAYQSILARLVPVGRS
jgi:MoaA/NifB/PqqE/SkfB family radical SAM enzyme